MKSRNGFLEKLMIETLQQSEKRISSQQCKETIAIKILSSPGYYTFINPFNVKFLDRDYLLTLNKANSIFVDGMLLVKYTNCFYGIKISRVSFDGNSLAPFLFEKANLLNKKIFFLGGEKSVAYEAANIVNDKYGSKIVVGTQNGFFNDIEDVIYNIKASESDVVIVGMGAPLQDKVAFELKQRIPNIVVLTCGGYLEQLSQSSQLEYYPNFISKLNLRAFYRLYKDPKKMFKRYFLDYRYFYFEVFSSACRKIVR